MHWHGAGESERCSDLDTTGIQCEFSSVFVNQVAFPARGPAATVEAEEETAGWPRQARWGRNAS